MLYPWLEIQRQNLMAKKDGGMEATINRLSAAERRRRVTIGLLAGALIASTFPVANERALFSPISDLPEIGNLSPVAYAVTFGFGGRPSNGYPPIGRRDVRRPPVAYAVRIPPGFPESSGEFLPMGLANPVGLESPVSMLSNQLGPLATPFSVGPDPFGPSGGVIVSPAAVAPVPEAATWIVMISGFVFIGAAMRRSRRRRHANSTNPCFSE